MSSDLFQQSQAHRLYSLYLSYEASHSAKHEDPEVNVLPYCSGLWAEGCGLELVFLALSYLGFLRNCTSLTRIGEYVGGGGIGLNGVRVKMNVFLCAVYDGNT